MDHYSIHVYIDLSLINVSFYGHWGNDMRSILIISHYHSFGSYNQWLSPLVSLSQKHNHNCTVQNDEKSFLMIECFQKIIISDEIISNPYLIWKMSPEAMCLRFLRIHSPEQISICGEESWHGMVLGIDRAWMLTYQQMG